MNPAALTISLPSAADFSAVISRRLA